MSHLRLKNISVFFKSTLGNYIKNFSWMMVENLIRIALGLTVSIYLTRFLGPHDYGILSYAVSLTGILSPIATLGIDAILLRNVIQDKTQEKILLQTARVLKLVAGLSLSVLTIIYVYFTREDRTVIIIIAILMVGITANSLNVYKEYIVSVNKMRLIAYASIFSLILSNFFRVGLILSNANVIWFATTIVSADVLKVIALRFYYKKISEFQEKYFSWTVAKKLLNDSWPLIFTSFAGIIFIYADQIIIEYFYDFEKVGIYASAVRLILFFTLIPSIISNMIYPKVIELYKQNEKESFIKKMTRLYFFHFIFATLLITFFLLLGKTIILTLYGDVFIESADILKIYSFTFVFVFFNPMNNKLLMIENLQKLMLVRNLIGLVINLLLNFLLIPVFGLKGAAFATVISQFAIMISYYFNAKTRYILGIQIRAIIYPLILFVKLFKK